MKYILFFLSVVTFACSSTRSKDEKQTPVTLKITTTSEYCGGAHPTDEILERLKKSC